MSTINTDLKNLNFQFLIIVRECARQQPMAAPWLFNLDAVEIEKISRMTLEELTEMAACCRAVFTLLPLSATAGQSPVSSSILAALLPVTAQA